MNKIILSVLITAVFALIITAGCITTDEKDTIVGTWVCGEYTNAAGMHYEKIYQTYYPDNTGVEKGYVADETTTQWNFIWVKKGDSKYEGFYSPILFHISSDGKTGTGDSTETFVNDWGFNRVSGDSGIIGEWKSAQKYMFENTECDIIAEFKEGGTGILTIKSEYGTRSVTTTWSELDEEMYVVALSEIFKIEIKSDGKLYDTFGCVYSRV